MDGANQQAYSDLMHSEFEDKLPEYAGMTINKHRLREFVYNRAKDLLNRMHPDWLGENKITLDAFRRLCEINMRIDLTRNLAQIIDEFNKYDAEARAQSSDIAAEHAENVKNFLFNETPSDPQDHVNSRNFRGGQTHLHLEACAGNFANVRDLVENKRANIKIEDNAGMTAEQACFYMGRIDIANYLKSKRLGQ
jgi:ankyrin repeat protein